MLIANFFRIEYKNHFSVISAGTLVVLGSGTSVPSSGRLMEQKNRRKIQYATTC